MRIATGCIGHETNTFSPTPTTLADFQHLAFYRGNQIPATFADTGTITGGYLQRCAELGIELIPLIWAFASPSGLVEQASYETMKREFLERLQAAGQVDGCLLDLHGAMVTEDHEDAEGDLITAVREIVGDRPIVTTLDLHANITATMAAAADVIIGFDTYPHVDMYERGLEAASVMHRILAEGMRPAMSFRQLPLLTGPPAQCTMKPIMSELIDHLHALEQRSGVVTATLAMGFPLADIHDAGAAVLVTTDGDPDLAHRCADEYATCIWERRAEFEVNSLTPAQAVERALQSDGGPFVLAEGADNPGGGGPCDGTHVLRAFVEADVQGGVIAIITDPESVAAAIGAGVSSEVDLNLGGKTIPLHGKPVKVRAYVKGIFDGSYVNKGTMARGRLVEMGRTVVLKIGGIEVIVTERRAQPFDVEALRSVGIEPRDRKIIALKSAVHFRADFTPFAKEIIDLDTPGIHSHNLTTYNYTKLRPVYPLDPDVTLP